eukprot:2098132-Rhodomonas_salina.1
MSRKDVATRAGFSTLQQYEAKMKQDAEDKMASGKCLDQEREAAKEERNREVQTQKILHSVFLPEVHSCPLASTAVLKTNGTN